MGEREKGWAEGWLKANARYESAEDNAAAWMQRAETAQARVRELEAELDSTERRHEEQVRAVRLRAEKAEASKAELIAEVEAWLAMLQGYVVTAGCAEALEAILDKHRGRP